MKVIPIAGGRSFRVEKLDQWLWFQVKIAENNERGLWLTREEALILAVALLDECELPDANP